MAVPETAATMTKSVGSIGSAGLLAAIAESTDFQVLVAVGLIVSTLSFLYDKDDKKIPVTSKTGSFLQWTNYVLAGIFIAVVVFYVLDTYVPDMLAMPRTVWLTIAGFCSGYALNIVKSAVMIFMNIIVRSIELWMHRRM